jgi:hypothetical protein
MVIKEEIRSELKQYLEKHRKPELVNSYLYFLETQYSIKPVIFPPGKLIFRSKDAAMKILEEEGKVWRETEIKIQFSPAGVNEETKKVYICPFSGKVFGDNTHPNPQDAIYDWVSKCPENTERVGGLRVKRFFVSEDSEVIKSYSKKNQGTKPISKIVYSSGQSGKLFANKKAVVKDFINSYLKPTDLIAVQNQNRFQIEESFLTFIQEKLTEENIANFVESLAEYEEFLPFVELWLEGEEEEDEEEEAEEENEEEAEEENEEKAEENKEEDAEEELPTSSEA